MIVEQVPGLYRHPQDPDDSRYVDLAITAASRFIVSRDADLLRLMDAARPERREFMDRFPQLRVLDPKTFLTEVLGSGAAA